MIGNWTISKKLVAGLTGVVVTVAAAMGGLQYAMSLSDVAGDKHARANEVMQHLQRAATAHLDQSNTARGFLLTKVDRHSKLFDTAVADYGVAIGDARKASDGDAVLLAEIKRVDQAAGLWLSDVGEPMMKLARAPQTFNRALELAKSPLSADRQQQFDDVWAKAFSGVNAAIAAAHRDEEFASRLFLMVQIAGSLTVLVLSTMIALWFSKGIAGAIREMTLAMQALAHGDLKAIVPSVNRTDEIGEMANALGVFKGNAIAARNAEATANIAKDEADARQKRAEADAIAAERRLVVNSIGAALERLAAKDLTYRMTGDLPEAYVALKRNVEAVNATLCEALGAVVSSGSAIDTGATELRAAADDLARRTEQQAANLEETSAALEQITTSVKQTAQGAASARDVVRRSAEEAEKIGQVVEQATAAMENIQTSSREVTQIIGLIDEIAFQTNLLALNAGVEAARAGESGKGFAVVASEVRALAQRSAGAAKEIKSLLSKSIDQVDHGVDLVKEVSASLAHVVQQVTSLNSLTSEFAAAADQQSLGLGEINKAVAQLDRMTQENASMVEQSTAATHTLGKEVHRLNSLVRDFNLVGSGRVAA